MQYFDLFHSDTVAASANQLFFTEAADTPMTGRVYYRITAGGAHNYSFLLSNVTDSTFDHGDLSRANRILPPWEISSMRVGICADCDPTSLASETMKVITLKGKTRIPLSPGAFVATDPLPLNPSAGDYLCLEFTYQGREIPYHEERIIPSFVKVGTEWVDSAHVPFVGMVGCDRAVKARVVFWGDSITQGIGTEKNSYTHWNARLSELLGNEYAYWNLGIGYGRASDAASLGAWFYKAKHADLAVVCFGVNDLLQTGDGEALKKHLALIVDQLQKAGVKVVLQTIPPFDYENFAKGLSATWRDVNEYIKRELSARVAAVYDPVPLLGMPEDLSVARFGGHPNEEGCRLWAEGLYPTVKKALDTL